MVLGRPMGEVRVEISAVNPWTGARSPVMVALADSGATLNLHVELPVTAPEAALGVSVEVPTLRGKVS